MSNKLNNSSNDTSSDASNDTSNDTSSDMSSYIYLSDNMIDTVVYGLIILFINYVIIFHLTGSDETYVSKSSLFILIAVNLILYLLKPFMFYANYEHLTTESNEALQDAGSVLNGTNLIVPNLTVTGTATIGNWQIRGSSIGIPNGSDINMDNSGWVRIMQYGQTDPTKYSPAGIKANNVAGAQMYTNTIMFPNTYINEFITGDNSQDLNKNLIIGRLRDNCATTILRADSTVIANATSKMPAGYYCGSQPLTMGVNNYTTGYMDSVKTT